MAWANGMRDPTSVALILVLSVVSALIAPEAVAVPPSLVASPAAPSDSSTPPGSADAPAAAPAAPANTIDLLCRTIETAASNNGLPLGFLTRLIWQESRFDARAISRAGAQGIAQFMPTTAQWVGLSNPFDAPVAINKSAALLGTLRLQFGNLGLAAAAYNAGPKRVSDWLARRRNLPLETLAYVRIVTGHNASEWMAAANPTATEINLPLPDAVPCPEIVSLFAEHGGAIAPQANTESSLAISASAAQPAKPPLPWGVQLVGGPSEVVAMASFYKMQRIYRAALESRQPMVLRTPVGGSGSWYRVRIGAVSRNDAERLCSNLRSVGGSCLVQPN